MFNPFAFLLHSFDPKQQYRSPISCVMLAIESQARNDLFYIRNVLKHIFVLLRLTYYFSESVRCNLFERYFLMNFIINKTEFTITY
jgi:hypothetical protein